MTTSEPATTVNLDQYGDQAMPWSAVAERLARAADPGQDVFTVLGTIRPDGRPHAAPIGSLWIDGTWYVVTGPGTQKGRNLAHNPACTVTARLDGMDVVFSGEAQRVTDHAELEHVADVYRRHGWPRSPATPSRLRTRRRAEVPRLGTSTGSRRRASSASGRQPT